MPDYRLAEVETKFADLIWDNEPINSGELVRLAEKALNWKKPTTYTMLRRLCARGIFKSENAVVTSLLKREAFFAGEGRAFIDNRFGGSVPAFIASLVGSARLSDTQADELIALIQAHKTGSPANSDSRGGKEGKS
ncbi:MAG: BlaI/MecI/CopY family transcriptional regulator [Oscillospiraceae bacterium]|jgi:predicted transcriptional regulator|nr:BlaI/MecI/CopY family transcriptional regulator [Oscillospiraceae bacterium]